MQDPTPSALTRQASQLDSPVGGLSLMIGFTFLWIAIAAYWLKGQDYFISTFILAAALIGLIKNYLVYAKRRPDFPAEEVRAAKTDKWFSYIFIGEGLAILISRNVLINLGLNQYVLAGFILVVGLHFYPLGILFKRTFDFIAATALSLVAIAGILLLHFSVLPMELTNAGMATSCALTTIAYGTRMILTCRKIVSGN